MSVFQKIVDLGKQLLPTGRAFRSNTGSNSEKLLRAFARSEGQAYNAMLSTLKIIIPDNEDITEDDATDWERRLGMITNSEVDLADRKAAILRKMAAPGRIKGRSHYLWIEYQLRQAGFDVYVYENLFPAYPDTYDVVNPRDLVPGIFTEIQLDDFQLNDFYLDGYLNHLVVNSLDNERDTYFDTGEDLRASLFIGGAPLGTIANVPAAREEEFRQLINQLKQGQVVAILFIDYT